VILSSAEHHGFLFLVDLFHEHLHAVGFPFLDLDDSIKVLFFVSLAGFDLSLDQMVVGRVDVLVERRRRLGVAVRPSCTAGAK
jgi:hypothetical protein